MHTTSHYPEQRENNQQHGTWLKNRNFLRVDVNGTISFAEMSTITFPDSAERMKQNHQQQHN
ncbi:hypothetical protein MAR_013798 [Mya arenaria]|uniref:Uncharacterized protein n=1 Tax=Mya arenaria TaxID=6604 RepID=A0ABY7G3J5_MYAAR|nr:hypothetical protein MAR_013798 [Mya arenaria]